MTPVFQHAYKEWSPIIDVLGRGKQILVLRKGGIAEGPEGFQPAHARFWLFPTHFHPLPDKLKPLASEFPIHSMEPMIQICYWAEVTDHFWLEDSQALDALDTYHFWAKAEVLRRWNFGGKPGLHALIVRVHAQPQPWLLNPDPAYGGCKSWISLPNPPAPSESTPVLDEASYLSRVGPLRKILHAA